MPTIEVLIAFAIASLILIVIPGPSVLFSIARALEYGRTGGIFSVLGNTLGSFVIALLVAFGIGSIVTQSATLFTIVKLLGAAYVIYLGVQGIRHRKDRPHADSETVVQRQSNLQIFGSGFLVGASNPKSIVFFIAVLPQFVSIEAGQVPLQMLVLALIFTVIAFLSDGVWVILAAAAREWFASSPGRLDTMKGIGGGMLIALGGALLFASNK